MPVKRDFKNNLSIICHCCSSARVARFRPYMYSLKNTSFFFTKLGNSSIDVRGIRGTRLCYRDFFLNIFFTPTTRPLIVEDGCGDLICLRVSTELCVSKVIETFYSRPLLHHIQLNLNTGLLLIMKNELLWIMKNTSIHCLYFIPIY